MVMAPPPPSSSLWHWPCVSCHCRLHHGIGHMCRMVVVVVVVVVVIVSVVVVVVSGRCHGGHG